MTLFIFLIMHLFPKSFVKGFRCGILMQTGVTLYKKGLRWATLICIMAFLCAGYSHCIALLYSWQPINYFIWAQVVLGNVLGAKIIYWLGVK